MLFQRTKPRETLMAGAIYERDREYNMKEHATITWVGEDCFGIPHVRFRVTIPGFDETDDLRVLAEDVFRSRYRLCHETQAA
ncbi:MAG TPA: hypothetical protein VE631_06930 [Alphaproteobacteria bacterium]|nr:hypothetical protein [Alphaproteobacteria bacterium]